MSETSDPKAVDHGLQARLLRRQRLTLGLMVTGYAGYYLCRSNLSVCLPLIIDDLGQQGVNPERAKNQIGAIVSAGTFAYAIGKFAGGGVSDMIGGRRNFLVGMIGSVVCTVLFAMGGALPIFTIAWVGNRLLQSLGWVGMIKITSRWFSYSNYGAVMGIVSLSFLFGDAAARFFMAGLLKAGLGWRGVFWIDALVLLSLFVLSTWLIRESPEELGLPEPEANPSNVFADGEDQSRPPRFSELFATLLTNPSFLTACVLSLGFTLLRETFNTWSPTYFVEALGLSKATAASRSALFPLLGGFSVILAGYLADKLGRVGRAAMMAGGLLLVGVTLAILGLVDFRGSAAVPVALVTLIAFLLIGPYSFLAGAIALDFGGKRGSATSAGLIDGIGYLGGILAGGSVAQLSSRHGWTAAFLVLAGVSWVSCLVAVVFLINQRRTRRAELAQSGLVPTLEKGAQSAF